MVAFKTNIQCFSVEKKGYQPLLSLANQTRVTLNTKSHSFYHSKLVNPGKRRKQLNMKHHQEDPSRDGSPRPFLPYLTGAKDIEQYGAQPEKAAWKTRASPKVETVPSPHAWVAPDLGNTSFSKAENHLTECPQEPREAQRGWELQSYQVTRWRLNTLVILLSTFGLCWNTVRINAPIWDGLNIVLKQEMRTSNERCQLNFTEFFWISSNSYNNIQGLGLLECGC